MANENNLSSGRRKSFTAKEICLHLIADCDKPVYRPKRNDNYYEDKSDYEYDRENEERRRQAEAEREEQELNENYLREQEENERLAYEQRLGDIREKYGYGTYISEGEDLNQAEERAKTDDYLMNW